MPETTKMTADAHAQLEADIAALELEGRREMADRIGVARAFGDLKENAEYHAAKEDAAMLEVKIARMRDQLRTAEIVEAVERGAAAGMGSTITYVDAQSGKRLRFTLVSGMEADPSQGLLSIDSPVGSALAGCEPGDEVELNTPSGARVARVEEVEHAG